MHTTVLRFATNKFPFLDRDIEENNYSQNNCDKNLRSNIPITQVNPINDFS